MILDAENQFSDAQAITADAISTNVIDMGVATDLRAGTHIPVLVQVVQDFNNLTSLTVELQESDVEDFSTFKVVAMTGAVPLADLKAGKQLPISSFPRTTGRFYRLKYDVAGTNPTEGKVTAAVVAALQTKGA